MPNPFMPPQNRSTQDFEAENTEEEEEVLQGNLNSNGMTCIYKTYKPFK
jgi:hypothetical protein